MAQEVEYQFTEDWFTQNIPVWTAIFEQIKPICVLEIGSYEGRSMVWIAEKMSGQGGGVIVCVDTWDDEEVEKVFDYNAQRVMDAFGNIALSKRKGFSSEELGTLRNEVCRYDLIYVDGSHKAQDVLSDAVDAFHLLRIGGAIIFDDYEGGNPGDDPLDTPKIAIDSFLKCFARNLEVMYYGYQVIVRKK